MSSPAAASREPEPARHELDRPPARALVITGFAAFFLLGWTVLLVPSLIRDVQGTFGQTDTGMGLAYFLNGLLYVAGTASAGVFAGRVRRPLLLAAGPALIAGGLGGVVVAGSWPVFLVGYTVMGLGAGLIDAGVNALFMDLFTGRAAMLNRLHLFFALGALAAPLAVGLTVGMGASWQVVVALTAVVAVPVALLLATRAMPPTRGGTAPEGASATGALRPFGMRMPLVLLSVAIACYVAAELGVSSWLVRYLDDAPIAVATLALSLFWAALALGRLVSSFIVDRMGAVRFAVTWSLACGAAIVVAINAPSVPLAIVFFAIAGFAAGPVYPMILAIAGTLYPGRASTVSSVLTSAAIVGSLVYPPLMGVVSDAAGLWVSMFGAGLFAFAAAAAIYGGARLGHLRQAVTPAAAHASEP